MSTLMKVVGAPDSVQDQLMRLIAEKVSLTVHMTEARRAWQVNNDALEALVESLRTITSVRDIDALLSHTLVEMRLLHVESAIDGIEKALRLLKA